MNLIYIELTRLVDDYNKCENLLIKELILSDINLLNKALLLSDQSEKPLH